MNELLGHEIVDFRLAPPPEEGRHKFSLSAQAGADRTSTGRSILGAFRLSVQIERPKCGLGGCVLGTKGRHGHCAKAGGDERAGRLSNRRKPMLSDNISRYTLAKSVSNDNRAQESSPI